MPKKTAFQHIRQPNWKNAGELRSAAMKSSLSLWIVWNRTEVDRGGPPRLPGCLLRLTRLETVLVLLGLPARLQPAFRRSWNAVLGLPGGDDRYLDDGVRILELTKSAYALYKKQNPAEKRKLLGVLLSNCTLEHGRITPTYKQPFDILAVMAKEAAHKKPADHVGQPVLQVWGE